MMVQFLKERMRPATAEDLLDSEVWEWVIDEESLSELMDKWPEVSMAEVGRAMTEAVEELEGG